MPYKKGLKLINYWTEAEQVDHYQSFCRGKGWYPSRVLWVLLTMVLDGTISETEIDSRYLERSSTLRDRRIKRLEDARK
jgi:hypothetical protein